MTESPRWERESHEDLSPPSTQPQDTVEMDCIPAPPAGLVDPGDLSDPPEYVHLPGDTTPDSEAERRVAAAREALATGRESARRSLVATRESARVSLGAATLSARRRLSAARSSTGASLADTRESLGDAAATMADAAGRAGRWVASLDRRPEFDAHVRRDPVAELTAGAGTADASPADGEPAADAPGRFPIARRGYDREAVDRHLATLEAELARLREDGAAPMSISEEIERLGEQTASILVTAHDKAHETARQAQHQAARAVTEAAHDAERITADAQRRLRELDDETDAVWRERERLLADVRDVSATLATLADAAQERFPGIEVNAAPVPEPEPAHAE